MTWLTNAPRILLGLTWITLGVPKLGSDDTARAIEPYVGPEYSGALATGLIVLEIVLGGVLIAAPRTLRRIALAVSLILLLVFAAYAIIDAPTRCTCAGRLAELSPLAHTVLTAAMLALVGFALRFDAARRESSGLWIPLAVGLTVGGVIAATVALTAHRVEAPVVERLEEGARMPAQVVLRGADAPQAMPSVTQASVPEVEDGLAGLVTDSEGRPVRGAEIWLGHDADYYQRDDTEIAVSDESGEFRLASSGGEEQSFVLARAPSLLSYVSALSALERDGRIHIRMERGGRIWGRVVDEQGEPVAEARVEAHGLLGEEFSVGPDLLFGERTVPEFAWTTTGADGLFELGGLPAASVRVHAYKAGYSSPSRREPVLVVPESSSELELKLRGLYVLNVLAVDADTEKPIRHATYLFVLPRNSGLEPAWDAGVRWSLPGVAGTGTGMLTRNGYREDFRVKADADAHTDAVGLRVSATGYTQRFVEVQIHPAGSAQGQLPVKLHRSDTGTLLDVAFEPHWGNAAPYTGSLLLRVAQGEGSRRRWVTPWFPVVFEEGRCATPLRLPPGEYAVRARGSRGSSMFLAKATAWASFVVSGGETSKTVTFPVQGGILELAPRSEDGVPIREFSYTITSASTASSARTWLSAMPYERQKGWAEGGGILLYLDGGEAAIRLKKHGFQPAQSTVQIPAGGATVRWAPTLLPAEE